MLKVAHKEVTTPNITQVYLEVKDRDKLEILTRIVDINNFKLSIVFCNTKKRVDEVTDMLQARGYLCDKIHGDMKQTLRMNVINKFKRNDIELLVATDVAARGLDIDDVEAVFNFDIPSHEEYYVHRIGRTGRAGKEGSSFTFITYRDYHLLRSIQRYTKSEMKFYPIPKISDIEAMKQDIFLSSIKDRIEAGIDQKFVKMIENFIDDSFSAKEVAATLLQMELEMEEKKEIDSIDNNRASTFKKSSNDRGDRRDNNRRDHGNDRGGKDRSRQGMARLHINVGNNNNVRVRDLVGAIANEASIEGSQIGSVDIFDTFSFVEIPEKHVERVMDRMKSSSIKGSPINIEIAKAKKKKVFGSKDYKKDGEHREKKRVKYKNPK